MSVQSKMKYQDQDAELCVVQVHLHMAFLLGGVPFQVKPRLNLLLLRGVRMLLLLDLRQQQSGRTLTITTHNHLSQHG
jgi:hypothetical protein